MILPVDVASGKSFLFIESELCSKFSDGIFEWLFSLLCRYVFESETIDVTINHFQTWKK